MMTRIAVIATIAMVFAGAHATASPRIGEPAPVFVLADTQDRIHALEQYRGEWVVLEWINYGCPYVAKHYRTGNIPDQQRKWRDRGVVWLGIVSSTRAAPGHQEPAELRARAAEVGSRARAVLMDSDASVARAYEARTTPHVFVIDPDGRLVYMGGIDDVATARDEDLPRATQLVDQALTEALAGEPVSVPVSRPYGCSVNYQ
jgi:peroxiredoxin